MTEDALVLPLTVTLDPPLFAAVDGSAACVQRLIEADIAELLRDLGVPARPVVQLEASDSQLAGQLVSLSVGERPCPFPRTTIAEALAYVDSTPQVVMDASAVLDSPQGSNATDAARIAKVLAFVCRAALSDQPEILVTASDDPVINAAMSLGMPISRGDTLAQDNAHESGASSELRIAALTGKTIDVHIDPSYLRFLTAEHPDAELFPFLRDSLLVELGLPLPPFHLRPDSSLRPGGFAFRVNAVRSAPQIGLSAGMILVNETVEHLALLNIDAEPTLIPATYRAGALVVHEHKASLEAAGFTTWDPFGFFMLSFATAVRRRAHALMTRDVAAIMLSELGRAFPVLEHAAAIHALVDVLTSVLRDLLLDGVPVRNLRRILELLLRYESLGNEAPRTDRITFVRWGLADVIASKAARGTATVIAYLLDPEIEDTVARLDVTASTDYASPLLCRLSAALRAELSQLAPGAQSPALLTRDELRSSIRALLRHEFPEITVLGYGDLPPDYNVQPLARISWT
jgi:type III secretory pathway component EscV